MCWLVRALAGTVVVAALWLSHPWLGRWPFLVSGALLALSPTAIAISRTASEDSLAVLLTFLLGWGTIRYWEHEDRRAQILGAAGIAVLLHLGYAGLTGVIVLVLSSAAYYAIRPQGLSTTTPAWLSHWSGLLVPFLGSFVLVGTGFFLHPGGFGLPSLQAWVQHFEPAVQEHPWYQPWLLLLGYELPVTAIGLVAALYSLWRWTSVPLDPGQTARGFLSLWAALGLVFFFLAERVSASAMLIGVVPLTVLAGAALGRGLSLLDGVVLRRLLVVGIPVSVAAGFAVVTVSEVARADGPSDGLRLLIAGTIAIAAVALLLIATVSSARHRAAFFLALTCLTLLVTMHATSRLAFLDPWPGSPRLTVQGVAAALDLLRLSPYTLQGRQQEVSIAQVLQPSLRWYLRGVPGVAYVAQLQPGPELLIGTEGAGVPSALGYQPRSLPLAEVWNPRQWSWKDVWRWFLAGERKPENSVAQHMVVWIRS